MPRLEQQACVGANALFLACHITAILLLRQPPPVIGTAFLCAHAFPTCERLSAPNDNSSDGVAGDSSLRKHLLGTDTGETGHLAHPGEDSAPAVAWLPAGILTTVLNKQEAPL